LPPMIFRMGDPASSPRSLEFPVTPVSEPRTLVRSAFDQPETAMFSAIVLLLLARFGTIT
jgi:hypothetical protein